MSDVFCFVLVFFPRAFAQSFLAASGVDTGGLRGLDGAGREATSDCRLDFGVGWRELGDEQQPHFSSDPMIKIQGSLLFGFQRFQCA